MADQTMLTVSYALSVPHGTNPPSLQANSEYAFLMKNLNRKVASNNREYYEELRKAIAAAKDKVGEELTAWRDALGNTELGKEKAAEAVRVAEDEEDEEDEEEEE